MRLCGCDPKPKNERYWCDNHAQGLFMLGTSFGIILSFLLILLIGKL